MATVQINVNISSSCDIWLGIALIKSRVLHDYFAKRIFGELSLRNNLFRREQQVIRVLASCKE